MDFPNPICRASMSLGVALLPMAEGFHFYFSVGDFIALHQCSITIQYALCSLNSQISFLK